MTAVLVDAVLLGALLMTTVTMLRVNRRLKRLAAEHGRLGEILGEMTEALDAVDAAVSGVRDEGGPLVLALAERIEEARGVLDALERDGQGERGGAAVQKARPDVRGRRFAA